jgi:hypothetical protein
MERPSIPPFRVPRQIPLHLERVPIGYGDRNLLEERQYMDLDGNLCKKIEKTTNFNTLLDLYRKGREWWPLLQECAKVAMTLDSKFKIYYISEIDMGFCIFLRSLITIDLSVNVSVPSIFISGLMELAKLPNLTNIYIIINRDKKANVLDKVFLSQLIISFLCIYCTGINVVTGNISSVNTINRYASNIRLRFEEADMLLINGKFYCNFPGVLETIGYRLFFCCSSNDIIVSDKDIISLESKEEFTTVVYRSDIPEDIETLIRLLSVRRVKKLGYEGLHMSDAKNYEMLMGLDLSNILELYVPIPIVNIESVIKKYPNIILFQVTGAIDKDILASGVLGLLERYPHIRYIYIIVPLNAQVKSCTQLISPQYCNKVQIVTSIVSGLPTGETLPVI